MLHLASSEGKFHPKPGEILSQAYRALGNRVIRLHRLRLLLDYQPAKDEPPAPEAIARVSALVAGLRDRLGSSPAQPRERASGYEPLAAKDRETVLEGAKRLSGLLRRRQDVNAPEDQAPLAGAR